MSTIPITKDTALLQAEAEQFKHEFSRAREAVAKVIDPRRLRWISFSHFEVDECGALNDWLEIAPAAQAACSVVGALVNLGDFAIRPARPLTKGETIETGRYRFRFHPTPHLPHGWDAGVLFDEGDRVLFCSDLFHQIGKLEPITHGDVVGRWDQAPCTPRSPDSRSVASSKRSNRSTAGGRTA